MFLGGLGFDVEPAGGLARANTTINVVPRERSATVGTDTSQSIRDNDPPAATVLNRSNTDGIGRVGRTGLPTRALSVRKPGVNDVAPASVSPKQSE